MENDVQIVNALPTALKPQVADILYDAFAPKIIHLELLTDSRERALRVYEDSLNLDRGLYALHEGTVVGVAGLDFGGRKLVMFRWATLLREFGLLGAAVRMVIAWFEGLNLPKKTELRIDGIAVAESMRSQGIGTSLLNAVFEYARAHGFDSVRLEVIDTNPGARRLYERLGFVATKTVRFGILTRRGGFSAAIVMHKRITG